MLHGRTRERERLTGLVRDAAAGRSSALLLEGPAGIGKSVLLADALARADGLTLLRAAGYESEQGIPYGALFDLLSPVLELRAQLPEAQREALDGALALGPARPHDRFAVPVALLSLLGVCAEERPVLVVVDDLHWLDDASLEAILFAAQRLEAEGVGVLLAARSGEGPAIDVPAIERLRIGPLEREDALRLLRHAPAADAPAAPAADPPAVPAADAFSAPDALPPLADEVAEQLLAACAGNPLALRELPRALTPEQRAGSAPLGGPPAAGGELQASFERQLARLEPATRSALCLVAAGAGCPPRAVRAALGPQVAALEPAVAAGVVRGAATSGAARSVVAGGDSAGGRAASGDAAAGLAATPDDEARIEFRHPLLAAAAYHGAASGERRAAHEALAAVVEDVQHRAWQLSGAALGPDPTAAATLREAGEQARARGAHAAAGRAFARAAELTPTHAPLATAAALAPAAPAASASARASAAASAPGASASAPTNAPPDRPALELAAAREHALAGHGELAAELATRASGSADPAVRDGADHLRAHLLMRGGAPLEAVATLRRLADRALAADDSAASAGYLLEASFAHMFRGEMHALAELAAEARDRAGAAAPEVAALASIAEGEALLALGRAREGDALLAAGEPLLFAADPLSDVAEVVGMAAMCSLWVEQFDRTERIVARMVDVTRAAGAAGRLVYPLTVRSQLHWRRGRWTQAYADAEESVRLAAETGQHGARALALAQLARAEAGLGRIDQARAHGQAGVELSDRAAGAATTLHSLAALGFTELTAGHADAALAALERADAIDRDLPLGEPALTLYAPDLIEALARSGRRDDASAALGRLEEAAARTGGAWAEAVAARGRLLLADESELDAHGAAALAAHARVPMPFERARTELVLGERLRRSRRRADARAHLQSAFDLLERLGAERWAERARMELIATGGRVAPRPPSAVEELTPHELQVALLVAEGRTNREVGAALFLSRKTIEHHLSAIYRKLDLRSRSQLAALLAEG